MAETVAQCAPGKLDMVPGAGAGILLNNAGAARHRPVLKGGEAALGHGPLPEIAG